MFISKYGVARHIYIPIRKRGVVDHAVGADWTPAAGDVKISKDGGAAANVTNLPVAIAMGNSAIWDFSLTATEMQAAQIVITVADSATKAVEDDGFIIETHGNASAQFQVDLADGVRAGLTALPNAAAEAAGGLYTRGAGAGQINQSNNGQIDANAARTGGTTNTARDVGAQLDAAVSTRLAPTVAARTLDVASTGEAGVDLANVNFPVGGIAPLGIVDNGTLQSATGTTAVIRAAASFADSRLIGQTIVITGGTGVGQARVITAYTESSKTTTVDTWTTTPDNTSTYVIFATAPASTSSLPQVDVRQWNGSAPNNLISGRVDANAQVVGDKTGYTASTVSDKTGYTVSTVQDKTGYTVSTVQDKTGYSLSAAGVQAIWDALTSALTTVGSIGKRLADFITGDAYVRLGAPAGASHAADVAAVKTDTAAIKAKTDNLPASPAAVSDIPTAAQNADKLLGRSIAGAADGGRTVTSALRKLRNKVAIATGTMTVYGEDDTTPDHQETVVTTAGNPISSVDPTT